MHANGDRTSVCWAIYKLVKIYTCVSISTQSKIKILARINKKKKDNNLTNCPGTNLDHALCESGNSNKTIKLLHTSAHKKKPEPEHKDRVQNFGTINRAEVKNTSVFEINFRVFERLRTQLR